MKTGIALGGGGIRGFAHLGMLKALKERGIEPNMIAGTSAGAIIGAFVAAGWEMDDIFNLLSKKSIYAYSRLKLPSFGLLNLEGLVKMLEKNIPYKNLEDLPVPFIVCATNLQKGEASYISEGNLAQMVAASSSVPVLFSPIEINGEHYVDGGITDNLPIRPLEDHCDKIISLSVTNVAKTVDLSNVLKMTIRVFQIGVTNTTEYARNKSDLLIEPDGIAEYEMLEITKSEEIFNLGYNYTMNLNLDSLK